MAAEIRTLRDDYKAGKVDGFYRRNRPGAVHISEPTERDISNVPDVNLVALNKAPPKRIFFTAVWLLPDKIEHGSVSFGSEDEMRVYERLPDGETAPYRARADDWERKKSLRRCAFLLKEYFTTNSE